MLTHVEPLVLERCCVCDMTFAMPEWFQKKALDRRPLFSFFCPKGHSQHYNGKSTEQQLRDDLARTKHLLEQTQARAAENRESAERIARRLSATQGVVTRQRNRIAAGKCPCCSKTFADVARHMRRQHPKWNPEKEAEVRGG